MFLSLSLSFSTKLSRGGFIGWCVLKKPWPFPWIEGSFSLNHHRLFFFFFCYFFMLSTVLRYFFLVFLQFPLHQTLRFLLIHFFYSWNTEKSTIKKENTKYQNRVFLWFRTIFRSIVAATTLLFFDCKMRFWCWIWAGTWGGGKKKSSREI